MSRVFLCLRGISELKTGFPEKSSLDSVLLTRGVGWDESAYSINFTGPILRIRRSIVSFKFVSESVRKVRYTNRITKLQGR